MSSYLSFLNGDRRPTDTTDVHETEDTRSDISADLSKLPKINIESKIKTSVIPQAPGSSTNADIDIDFKYSLDELLDVANEADRARIEAALNEARINNNGKLTEAQEAEIMESTLRSIASENDKKVKEAASELDAAKDNYENTKEYVEKQKNNALSEIERLSSIPKYKVVDDARAKMDQAQTVYEDLVTTYRDLENTINTTANEFETLLYTNQANFESINDMKSSKSTIEDELTILRETVGANDPEYMKKVDEYVAISEKLSTLEETHVANITAMNQKELQLKNLLDKSDVMKIEVDTKRKEYNDARVSFENIDMDKIESDYNKILDEIDRNQNILNTIDSEVDIAYADYLSAQDKYTTLASRQPELDAAVEVAKQTAEDAKMYELYIEEENRQIDEQLRLQNEILMEAKKEKAEAERKNAEAKAKLAIAKDAEATAKKQLEQAKKELQNAQKKYNSTGKAQSVLIDASAKVSAQGQAQKKVTAMMKDVTNKTNKVKTIQETVKSTSSNLSAATSKVKTIESQIKQIKNQRPNVSTEDNTLLKSTINTVSIDSILSKINKNLNIPNPTDTLYSSIEKYSNYYNRFKKPDLTTILRNGYPHVFFVRPSCNILDSNYNLISSMKGNPDFSYAAKSAKWLLRELVASNGQNHDFMLYPSAYASSFSLSDEYITTTTYGKNYVGDQIAIGQSNIESKTAGTFEIQFRDDKRLHIYQLHKLWTEYISGCYLGDLFTKSDNIKKKILDYVGAVYYIVTAEDGETIIFWSKYYGVFPTQIPSTQYSWGAGNTITDTNISIQYQYSSKTDYNPKSIVEFNHNARCSDSTKYVPIYDPKLNGVGRTMVGVPFITLETNDVSGCPYVLKLRFKDPGKNV